MLIIHLLLVIEVMDIEATLSEIMGWDSSGVVIFNLGSGGNELASGGNDLVSSGNKLLSGEQFSKWWEQVSKWWE